jgi:hypothetical protein
MRYPATAGQFYENGLFTRGYSDVIYLEPSTNFFFVLARTRSYLGGMTSA